MQPSWTNRTRRGFNAWRTLLAGLALSASGAVSAQTYCASDGGDGNTFNIDRVQFAGIDNTSGDNNGYGDFTALSATVQPGTSYGITLDPNGPFFLRYRWRAWIDWDQDGTFGANELVFQQTGFGQETGTIAVPANALPGSTRMRVNMSAFAYRGACANWNLGEVEDYTIVVPPACDATAGSLDPIKPEVCLTDANAGIGANVEVAPVVPAGFEVIYVLTSGSGLVIQGVSAQPAFQVTSGGLYTIHTLVYDPNTLDLSIVEPGVTTGFDVNSLLIQGGGSICAALDVAGAQFNVTAPNAGTLSGGSDVCLSGADVVLTATPNGDSNTPDGYSLAYVLTSGSNLVIQQLGAEPSFTVTSGGLYTIHTFVFPSDLDLSVVEPGVTTGGDVLGLLAANSICASLDVAGAAFNVADPNAGTLSGGGDVCLSGDAVTLTATPNGDSNTPDGYNLAYVLTSGSNLVIQQLGAEPSFTVTSGGLYTIHTFVFPSDLDLSVVEPGVTTGGDVLGLLSANNICASLDVTGAAFNVAPCEEECLADAGNITPSDFLVCWATEQLIGVPAGDAVVPAGYEVLYVLTRGNGLVIRQVNTEPVFNVNQNGIYRIHTLVYDPNTLDLSIVVPGTTTGFDVNSLLIQGGGGICASLDVEGAPFIAVGPVLCAILDIFRDVDTNDPQAMAAALESMDQGLMLAIENDQPVAITSLWPNPTNGELNVDVFLAQDANVRVEVTTVMGQQATVPQAVTIGQGNARTTIDVSGLAPGSYMLRIVAGEHVATERFVKVN